MKLSDSQRNALARAVEAYEQEAGNVLSYLQDRGLGVEEVARFRLGYVDRAMPGHEQMTGRLAIPFLTPAGPVDIRFRCVKDHDCKLEGCPKYLGLPGRQTPLFNVAAVRTPGKVIGITEGELDAVVLDSNVMPAVGVPGAEAWKDHYGRVLADFDQVLVFCDGDQAGRGLGRTVAREIPGAVPIHLPDGEDVNSMFLKEGADGLRARAGLQPVTERSAA